MAADLREALREAAGPAPEHGPDYALIARRAKRRRAARRVSGVAAVLLAIAVAFPLLPSGQPPPQIIDQPPGEVEQVPTGDRRFDDLFIPRPQWVVASGEAAGSEWDVVAHPNEQGEPCLRSTAVFQVQMCFPLQAELEFSTGQGMLATAAVGVTRDLPAVEVSTTAGETLRVATTPVDDLGVRTFVVTMQPEVRVTSVVGLDGRGEPATRGDAVLLRWDSSDWYVVVPGFQSGYDCLEFRTGAGPAARTCADPSQLLTMNAWELPGGHQRLLVVSSAEDITQMRSRWNDPEDEHLGTTGTAGGPFAGGLDLGSSFAWSNISLTGVLHEVEIEGADGELAMIVRCDPDGPPPLGAGCTTERIVPTLAERIDRFIDQRLMTSPALLALLALVLGALFLLAATPLYRWLARQMGEQ